MRSSFCKNPLLKFSLWHASPASLFQLITTLLQIKLYLVFKNLHSFYLNPPPDTFPYHRNKSNFIIFVCIYFLPSLCCPSACWAVFPSSSQSLISSLFLGWIQFTTEIPFCCLTLKHETWAAKATRERRSTCAFLTVQSAHCSIFLPSLIVLTFWYISTSFFLKDF